MSPPPPAAEPSNSHIHPPNLDPTPTTTTSSSKPPLSDTKETADDEVNGLNANSEDGGGVGEGVCGGEKVIRNGHDVSDYLVSDRDDGDACFTLRSITLGLLGATFQTILTQIYRFKPTSVSIAGTFLAILIYILGKTWAKVLPTKQSFEARFGERKGRLWGWIGGLVGVVNPGGFGLKEHAIASITANSASVGGIHSSDVFGTQKLFYPDIPVSNTTAILSVLSIGLFGYGLAGIFRPVIVYPAEMVYWKTLPMVDLFQAFHWHNRFSSKRIKTFWYTFTAMAFYEFLPAYIFPMLNSVSIPCLASTHAPKNIAPTLTNIFGGAQSNEGMGFLSLSFDWQYITSSPLSLPLLQQANSWIGYAICYIAMAAIYYGNVWNAKSFPFMSTSIFAQNGSRYNQSDVFRDGILDRERLESVGYPNVTGTFAWGMLMQNASIGGLVAYVVLFWGKHILKSLRQARDGTQPDRHWRAMRKYEEAPHWWYGGLLGVSFVFGLVVVLTQETTLPWYSYVVALMLGAVVAPFSGLLYALLGQGIHTNNLTKMVGGIVSPGRPLANLYFYAWSHSTIVQVVTLCDDLKMGQYLKIPPRVMFVTQVMGTILGSFLNYAIASTIISSKFALLHTNSGSYAWSGAYYQSLNVSAVTWSMAKYTYGPGTAYFIIPMAVLIGMAAVTVHWIFTQFVPRIGAFNTRDLILPTVFFYATWMTSNQTSVILSTIVVGAVSQLYMRTRRPKWFKEYNYLLGAAWDGGSLLVVFILSFAVFGAAGREHPFPKWWGNPNGFPDHCPSASSK